MSSGAPLEVGQAIRYPSAALLCVSTHDGFQYTKDRGELIVGPNPANLIINKGRTLLPGKFTRLALTEAQIEWDIPNVNSNNNTITIDVQDASGVHSSYVRVEVPVGFYSPAILISQLETALNTSTSMIAAMTLLGATAPYFQVGLETGGAATITPTGGPANTTVVSKLPAVFIRLLSPVQTFARFNIMSCAADPSVTGFSKLNDDLTNMLGMTPTTFGVKSYVQIYGGYASFQYTPYVDLTSLTLTKNQKVTDTDSSDHPIGHKLARIYFTNETAQPFFADATYDASGNIVGGDDNIIGTSAFTLRREFKHPKQIQWNTEQYVDYIELQLLDSKGQYLPIQFNGEEVENSPGSILLFGPSGAEYRFTMQVSEQ